MNPTLTAQLAAEFWKTLRSLDRAAAAISDDKLRAGIEAHARFARGRLETILAAGSLSLMTFEGRIYEPNLPVSAVNADEFNNDETELVVSHTLEPTVIQDMVPLVVGRVMLSRKDDHASRN
jgi:hypothetical protein